MTPAGTLSFGVGVEEAISTQTMFSVKLRAWSGGLGRYSSGKCVRPQGQTEIALEMELFSGLELTCRSKT